MLRRYRASLVTSFVPHGLRTFASFSPALRFCIVGSGPAGFYTASQLLKKFGEAASVDIIDRLPTPFGLVRSGVAPDHPGTKNVVNQFTEVGKDPRVAFLGNVHVGVDISLPNLRTFYNAVVLAYGAESDRVLGIPGEGLRGVWSAREFVWWYNGHPEYRNLPVDLAKVRQVVICGMGNVAVDCARVLLQEPSRLAATDITAHALRQLQSSTVERVDLVGRRGPAQASFTAKELREVLGLDGVRVVIPPETLQLTAADEAELKTSRKAKRIYDILLSASKDAPPVEAKRELHLKFLRSPVEMLENVAARGDVAGVRLAVTRLEAPAGGGPQRAVLTGESETLQAQMVLKSIGYKSVPLEGALFDPGRGIIPNSAGRVLASDSTSPEPGLYVCGWLKRGPSGIIGTNLFDAEETVASIVADTEALPSPLAARPGSEGVRAALQTRGIQVVDFPDWLRINGAEVERGKAAGKPREKVVDVEEMLHICRQPP